MFDILVYLFENYYQTDFYPDQDALARKLSAAGFEHEDISDALAWLQGLSTTETSTLPDSLAQSTAFRGYAEVEASKLGVAGRGFLAFLEGAKVLTPLLREIIIERAMAKKPEDRFQQPGEMEQALTDLFNRLAAEYASRSGEV